MGKGPQKYKGFNITYFAKVYKARVEGCVYSVFKSSSVAKKNL